MLSDALNAIKTIGLSDMTGVIKQTGLFIENKKTPIKNHNHVNRLTFSLMFFQIHAFYFNIFQIAFQFMCGF